MPENFKQVSEMLSNDFGKDGLTTEHFGILFTEDGFLIGAYNFWGNFFEYDLKVFYPPISTQLSLQRRVRLLSDELNALRKRIKRVFKKLAFVESDNAVATLPDMQYWLFFEHERSGKIGLTVSDDWWSMGDYKIINWPIWSFGEANRLIDAMIAELEIKSRGIKLP